MAKDIYTILRKRYPEGEYALMEEVSDRAGLSRSRSADYMVMNLWPSRGLSLNGIELKSFRSDWLSELKKPQKAENIFKFCDYFWLLTADETVAKLEEIPEAWGWLCIKGERIFVKKEAPRLVPVAISRDFLAALLKRGCSKDGFVRIATIEERIEQAKVAGRDESQREMNRITSKLNELKTKLDEYKAASGIDLYNIHWRSNVQNIGAAVKFINDGGAEAMQQQLVGLEEKAKVIQERIADGIKAMKSCSGRVEESGKWEIEGEEPNYMVG